MIKHLADEDDWLEQWFLVALDSDESAKVVVGKTITVIDAVIEIVGHIPAPTLAEWGMTDGDVRLVLPGQPIGN